MILNKRHYFYESGMFRIKHSISLFIIIYHILKPFYHFFKLFHHIKQIVEIKKKKEKKKIMTQKT